MSSRARSATGDGEVAVVIDTVSNVDSRVGRSGLVRTDRRTGAAAVKCSPSLRTAMPSTVDV